MPRKPVATKYGGRWNGKPDEWGKGFYRDQPWSQSVLKSRARHIADLKRAAKRDPDFPFYFDWKASQHAVTFIQLLRHVEGEWAGRPFELSDWQEWDIVRPLFGWKCLDGTRRYRDAFISVARKNGKSSLIAAMGAYLFLADNEFGAQVYSAATKEEQARIVFDMARRMIEFSPELRAEIKTYKKSFINERTNSRFMPLGRDSKTMDGFSVHCGIIDEYHAHKTSEMYDVLDDGRGARRQSLLLNITTAGFNVSSPCKKEWDVVMKILDGTLRNERYFGFIATVDDPQKWREQEEWIKANPNFGISIYAAGFQSDFEKADASPQKQNSFKTKRLNVWTEQATRWISMEKYALCDGEISLDFLKGRRCFGGLDLGISRDISALALAFLGEDKATGEPDVFLLMKYWIPEVGKYERYRNDGVNYPEWADAGWITTTPGETTRYDYIRRDINALAEEYEIAEIAIDRAHAHELMVQLADDGLDIVRHSQNMMAMNFPCRSFEEIVLNRRLQHGNDPVFRWMVSNCAIIQDGNENIKIVKDKSGDRVDGVVAAVMAIGRLLIAPEPKTSVYESRGLVIL